MDKTENLDLDKHARPVYTCKNITVADKCVIFDLKIELGAGLISDRDMTLIIKKSTLKEMLKTLARETGEIIGTSIEDDLGGK